MSFQAETELSRFRDRKIPEAFLQRKSPYRETAVEYQTTFSKNASAKPQLLATRVISLVSGACAALASRTWTSSSAPRSHGFLPTSLIKAVDMWHGGQLSAESAVRMLMDNHQHDAAIHLVEPRYHMLPPAFMRTLHRRMVHIQKFPVRNRRQ